MKAKIVAKGKIQGEDVKIVCSKKNKAPVKVAIFSSCDKRKKEYIKAAIGELYQENKFLKTNLDPVPLYNPEPGTIEAYLVAIHESGVFDYEPQVKVSDDIDLFGSPYDDWDKPECEGVAF